MTDNPAKTEDQDPPMIKRIARAICIARQVGKRPYYDPDMLVGFGFIKKEPWPIWHNYREAARAAVAAMREPTQAMCKHAEDSSGVKIDNHYVQPICSECAAILWRAMIDKALEE